MPHTFFPDAVAFLSVVTEKDRSPTKIQFLFILIFPCFKKKKITTIPNTTATKQEK